MMPRVMAKSPGTAIAREPIGCALIVRSRSGLRSLPGWGSVVDARAVRRYGFRLSFASSLRE